MREQVATGCGCGPNPFDGKPVWSFWREAKRRDVFRTEFTNNALFLIKWLALAYVLEALLVTYVPASLIAGLVGGEGIAPIAIAALVGMPAYLNSYIAPPLLSGLMEQGMSSGAAMSFMVAGAVSSGSGHGCGLVAGEEAGVRSLSRPRYFRCHRLRRHLSDVCLKV